MIDKNSEMWKIAAKEVHAVIPIHLQGHTAIDLDDVRELMTLAFLRGIGWHEDQIIAARNRRT